MSDKGKSSIRMIAETTYGTKPSQSALELHTVGKRGTIFLLDSDRCAVCGERSTRSFTLTSAAVDRDGQQTFIELRGLCLCDECQVMGPAVE